MHASASFATPDFQVTTTRRAGEFAHVRPVTYHAPESQIYAQGEPAGAIYRIEYGAVRVCRLLSDGRRQVVAFHFAGEIFGLEADSVHSFYAEAIVPTGLTKAKIGENGHPTPELMAIALRAMVRAQEHLLVVGRQNALEKLAVFLVDLAERQGGLDVVIDLPMTRTDIGDYLGLTVETVSRNLSKLRGMGILCLKNTRCVQILKPARLRLLSE